MVLSILNSSSLPAVTCSSLSVRQAKDKIGQALRDAIKNVRARCRSERKESSPIETVHENAAVATVEAQSKPKAYQVGDDETNKAYDHPSSGTPNDLSSLLEGICASNEGKRQVSLLDKLFDHSMSLSSLDERSTSCPELFPPGKWGKTDLSPLNVGATQKPHHQRGSGLSAALAMMGQLEQSASSPCLNSSNWKKRALPSAVNGGWTSDIAPIDVHTKRGLVVPEDQPCKRRRQFVLGAICESTVSTGNEERAQPNRRSSGFLESLLGTSPLDLPGPASQEVSVLPRDLSNYLAQGPKSHQGYQKNDETMFAPSYPAIWKMGSPPKYINQTSTSFSCQEDNQSSTRRYSLTSRVATEFGLLDSCSSGLEQVSGNNRDAISQLLSDLEPTPISYPTTNPAADHARSA